MKKRTLSVFLIISGFLWLLTGWKIIQINGNQIFWAFINTTRYGANADWSVYAETLSACVISSDLIACILICIGLSDYRK